MKPNTAIAFGGVALAVLAAASCSRPELVDSTPPPVYDAPQPQYEAPPEFGRPPPPPPQGPTELLGAPPAPPAPIVTELMAPVKNPEDLSAEEYARIYHPGEKIQAEMSGEPGAGRNYARAPGSTLPSTTSSGQSVSRSGSAQSVGSARSAQNAPSQTQSQPSSPSQTRSASGAPVPAQPPAASAEAEDAPTGVDAIGAALAELIADEAVWEIPESLATWSDGVVTLTLPPSLLDRLQEAAGEEDLSLAARAADIGVQLSGDGYAVSPSDKVSQPLQSGESARFSWQVSPGEAPSGSLAAKVTGELKGLSRPQAFDVAEIDLPVTGEEDGSAEGGLPQGLVAFGIIGLLILVFVVIAARAASGRKQAERRRRNERREQELESQSSDSNSEAGDSSSS